MMPNVPCSEPLPQPAAAAGTLRTLAALAQLIEQGWQIEPPVLVRLAWAPQCSGEQAYHIILKRANQRTLVVLPDSPRIHRFLCQHDIPVR